VVEGPAGSGGAAALHTLLRWPCSRLHAAVSSFSEGLRQRSRCGRGWPGYALQRCEAHGNLHEWVGTGNLQAGGVIGKCICVAVYTHVDLRLVPGAGCMDRMQSAMCQLETRQVRSVHGCWNWVSVNQTPCAATTCLLDALVKFSPKRACAFQPYKCFTAQLYTHQHL